MPSEALKRSWAIKYEILMHYVYIFKLDNGEYYTGYTKNLRDRIKRHIRGSTRFTGIHKIEDLVFYAAFPDKQTDISFEEYLKSSSGKAFRNKRLLYL